MVATIRDFQNEEGKYFTKKTIKIFWDHTEFTTWNESSTTAIIENFQGWEWFGRIKKGAPKSNFDILCYFLSTPWTIL